jgi:hypothetical protein
MGQCDHRQQARVIVSDADALRRVDDVLARPRSRSRPPTPMCDRHERAQRRVRVTAVEHLPRDRDERVGRAGLGPHVPADHLLQPSQPGRLDRARRQRLHLPEEAPHHVDEAKLIRNLSSTDQPLALPYRIGRERGRTFQRGSGTGHRAAAPCRRGMCVERDGDFLIAADGGRRPVPELTLGIYDSRRERAVHLKHLRRECGLPHR